MSASAFHRAVLLSAVGLGVAALSAVPARTAAADCRNLPSHADLEAELVAAVNGGGNGGLGNDMWGTLVDRDGIVCAVAFSGDKLATNGPVAG